MNCKKPFVYYLKKFTSSSTLNRIFFFLQKEDFFLDMKIIKFKLDNYRRKEMLHEVISSIKMEAQ